MTMAKTLESFRPISLEELNSDAEMLSRVDRKYVLSIEQAEQWLLGLSSEIRALTIAGTRQCRYETTYFDTNDLVSFAMTVQQRRRRVKVRTRSYLDTHDSYLETKTRSGEDLTVKERIRHPWMLRNDLTPRARHYAGGAFTNSGLPPCLADDLAPALLTKYRRATLLAPDGNGRVTIDTELLWQLPTGEQLAAPQLVIVETKSSTASSELDRSLWGMGIRPTPISKFATGLAALRPELPHNRWARLLRSQFFQTDQKETPQCSANL